MSQDDTRNRILDAAGPIFAEKGFQQATVREICQTAGVNVASVNYYFGDKERLYIEAVKLAHVTAAEQVPLPEWPEGTPPEQKLRDFIRMTAQRLIGVTPVDWQVRLMMRETTVPSRACHEVVEDYVRPHLNMACEILREVLPAGTPHHVTLKMAFTIVGQCLHYRLARGGLNMLVEQETLRQHFTLEALIDHITQVTLAALGLGPAVGHVLPEARDSSADHASPVIPE